jgi:hypothetical protein
MENARSKKIILKFYPFLTSIFLFLNYWGLRLEEAADNSPGHHPGLLIVPPICAALKEQKSSTINLLPPSGAHIVWGICS